jgi:hypothetical protein
MNIYQQLTNQAEAVVRKRFRIFVALLAVGGALGLGACAYPLWLTATGHDAMPVATLLDLIAVLVTGVGLVLLGFRIDNKPMPNLLRAHMEALTDEAAIADFALHAPLLPSVEALARITDAALLTRLALEGACAEVRREAAARLPTADARLAVAAASTDEQAARVALAGVDANQLARVADGSPLPAIRLAAAGRMGDAQRVLREMGSAPQWTWLNAALGWLKTPDDLAAAAVQLQPDGDSLTVIEHCELGALSAQAAQALAARLHAMLTRDSAGTDIKRKAAALLKAMYLHGSPAADAAGQYAGTPYRLSYSVEDRAQHSDDHTDDNPNCHSVDDYCSGIDHNDSHTDDHVTVPVEEDITLAF